MKKIILSLTLLFFSVSATIAQRFAYVDTEYILNLMPEYKSAQKQLDMLALDWQKEIEKKKAELEKLKSDYEAEKIFLLDEMKQQRESQILLREKEIKDFQLAKFGVNGELFKKREELIKPIQDRVYDAIQKVAKDNALDVIFDKAGAVTMLYTNPKWDRSDEVLEELGIVAGANPNQNQPGGNDEPPQEMPK